MDREAIRREVARRVYDEAAAHWHGDKDCSELERHIDAETNRVVGAFPVALNWGRAQFREEDN